MRSATSKDKTIVWGRVSTLKPIMRPVTVAQPMSSSLGYSSYHHVGATQPNDGVNISLGIVNLAGAALGAYHGYKRNRGSATWAVVWGVLGALFPIVTGVVAVAQGLDTPKGKS